MKRIIVCTLTVLALCQCNSPQRDILKAEMTDTVYIDKTIRKIMHQYIKSHPKIDNIGLYFDCNIDSSIIQLYGDGTYFVIKEVGKQHEKSNDNDLNYPIPLSYFCMDNKIVYIIPSLNILKTGTSRTKYFKTTTSVAFHKKQTVERWLIKCEWDYSRLFEARKKVKIIMKF